jgi:hypothetical protein
VCVCAVCDHLTTHAAGVFECEVCPFVSSWRGVIFFAVLVNALCNSLLNVCVCVCMYVCMNECMNECYPQSALQGVALRGTGLHIDCLVPLGSGVPVDTVTRAIGLGQWRIHAVG